MVIAGAWFFVGAVINAAAQDLAMLYIGRVFLGFGVGFANQSVIFRLNMHLTWLSHRISVSAQSCFMILVHESFC